MTLYVTEHAGAAGTFRQPLTANPIASYSLTSASTAPFPSAGASFIRVNADSGMLLNLNSNSTGLSLTSTNAFRVPGGTGSEFFACSTSRRITAQST